MVRVITSSWQSTQVEPDTDRLTLSFYGISAGGIQVLSVSGWLSLSVVHGFSGVWRPGKSRKVQPGSS